MPKVIVTNDAGSRWGFAPIKWAVFEIAPLTASGLNEIITIGKTRKQAVQMAMLLGIRPTARGQYQVVRLEKIKEELNGS